MIWPSALQSANIRKRWITAVRSSVFQSDEDLYCSAEKGDAGGVKGGTFGAADAPDAVLFKLATFIHMYSCTMRLTPLDSTSLLP